MVKLGTLVNLPSKKLIERWSIDDILYIWHLQSFGELIRKELPKSRYKTCLWESD